MEPFKNVFNERVCKELAERIKSNYKEFDKDEFLHYIFARLKSLSFSERNILIKDALIKYLPKDFAKSCKILIKSLPQELEGTKFSNYDCFIVMPMSYYIADEGLDERNFDIAMNALYEMTKRLSSEGAIRYFVLKHENKTFEKLNKWVNDKNVHVRRLCSEGIRPRLPWAMALPKFKKDPTKVIKILEKLKDDKELYVRRSVANNLNDIAKDNPEIVVKILRKWNKDTNKETQWIVKHASRTLIKQGHNEVLSLLGYEKPDIELISFNILNKNKKVKIGNDLTFEFEIISDKNQNLMIDYIMHFVKSNGKTSPKVFKLSSKKVKKEENIKIKKKHSFKYITTRVYYPGKHHIELQINGVLYGKVSFDLI